MRAFQDARDLDFVTLAKRDVVVVSYGLVVEHLERFVSRTWSTLVIDEAQQIKNSASQRRAAVQSLPRDFTLLLTGTPLENHLGELWSLVDVAFPGLLGSEATFRERFRRPIETGKGQARLRTLGQLLTPFLLRRTRAEVLTELPARQEIVETVDLSPSEQKRYNAMRVGCEAQFGKKEGKKPLETQRIAILAALTRLRQIAWDPALVDKSDARVRAPSSKLLRLAELCLNVRDQEGHTLVFSQFTSLLERARVVLEGSGLRVAYLTGSTPIAEREELVLSFQRGDFDVFCISLKAGGSGLHLTRAAYVIHLDPWWNPAVEEQAIGRAHRMGQSSPVTAYRLVARGTIEEAMLAMHADKRALVDSVLEGKSSGKVVNVEQLLALVSHGEQLDANTEDE